jgi:hypothetical protein
VLPVLSGSDGSAMSDFTSEEKTMTEIDNERGFPVLYGRPITNTRDLTDVLTSVMADVVAGRITPKEANAINREARDILKIIQTAMSARSLYQRIEDNNRRPTRGC